ncbi:MAG: murein biosynthesis integral membrane protein MurJ [Bdellovibrionia bacterium]
MLLSAERSSSSGVLRAAGAMGAATFLSRIMGLVREQVFAIMFGAGNMTDAYNVAFRIPNLLRDLFAEGAMSASLVPTFTRTRVEEGDRRAWRVAGLVFRVLFALVGLITVLGIIFAPQLVSLYASAFKEIPGKFELTVQLTRTMFPFFPLVALAAAFMGILNACGVFFLPAFASALFNLASILVGVAATGIILTWGASWGVQPIVGMAVGVLAGGFVQAFCQLPALYKKGYRWVGKSETDPSWRDDPRLRRMLWMMVPGTIGLAATQVNLLVNTILATSQGTGAVSWLNYAFRLMQFPIGIFGVSLAAATLPKISRQWVSGNIQGVAETLTHSIRSVFAINLPASAGLYFLGFPIIELIFQYGRFTSSDTQATATALGMYSIGLTAYSAVKVLVPACYALGNTRLPVLSSVMAVLFTIILNILMVKPFGYWGLALGTSLAAILNATFLLGSVRYLIRKKGGLLPVTPIVTGLVQYLLVAAVMGGICYFSKNILQYLLPDALFPFQGSKVGILLGRGTRMSLLLMEGVGVVIFLATVLKLKEATEVINLFAEKLRNKLRPSST